MDTLFPKPIRHP